MIRALVLGRNGQLARELSRAGWPQSWQAEFAARGDIDLTEPEAAASAVMARKPDIVINAAAYTAVDKAESEPELAMRINAQAPGALAQACAEVDIPFVTVSTDYVFDGSNDAPYTENDVTSPASVYGRSKAEGEAAVQAAHDWHLILRTSWVFSPFGSNFVKTMLRLGAERDCISVVADQRGRPTSAADLARAIVIASEALLRDRALAGTYHGANAGAATWYDFAAAIFAEAKARGQRAPQLKAIAAADYPTPARRPANSVLATHKFERAFGVTFRPWREALGEALDELLLPSAVAV